MSDRKHREAEYRKDDLVQLAEPILGAWGGVVTKVRKTARGVELEIAPFYTAEGARLDLGRFTATEDGRDGTVPIREARDE